MGVHIVSVVSDWETAKECLTTNDKAFASRSKMVAMEVLSYNHVRMIVGKRIPNSGNDAEREMETGV